MATTNLNMIKVVIATIMALAISAAAQLKTSTPVTVEIDWHYGADYQTFIKNYDLWPGDALRMCLQSYVYKFTINCFVIYILIWNVVLLHIIRSARKKGSITYSYV